MSSPLSATTGPRLTPAVPEDEDAAEEARVLRPAYDILRRISERRRAAAAQSDPPPKRKGRRSTTSGVRREAEGTGLLDGHKEGASAGTLTPPSDADNPTPKRRSAACLRQV